MKRAISVLWTCKDAKCENFGSLASLARGNYLVKSEMITRTLYVRNYDNTSARPMCNLGSIYLVPPPIPKSWLRHWWAPDRKNCEPPKVFAPPPPQNPKLLPALATINIQHFNFCGALRAKGLILRLCARSAPIFLGHFSDSPPPPPIRKMDRRRCTVHIPLARPSRLPPLTRYARYATAWQPHIFQVLVPFNCRQAFSYLFYHGLSENTCLKALTCSTP